MKILIEFPDDQIRALEVISPREAIRQALASHVEKKITPISAFGLWKPNEFADLKDQTGIRHEW